MTSALLRSESGIKGVLLPFFLLLFKANPLQLTSPVLAGLCKRAEGAGRSQPGGPPGEKAARPLVLQEPQVAQAQGLHIGAQAPHS